MARDVETGAIDRSGEIFPEPFQALEKRLGTEDEAASRSLSSASDCDLYGENWRDGWRVRGEVIGFVRSDSIYSIGTEDTDTASVSVLVFEFLLACAPITLSKLMSAVFPCTPVQIVFVGLVVTPTSRSRESVIS